MSTSASSTPNQAATHSADIRQHIALQPNDAKRLANLTGALGKHLQQLEKHFDVVITHRGNDFNISGDKSQVAKAAKLLKQLYIDTSKRTLSEKSVQLRLLENHENTSSMSSSNSPSEKAVIRTPKLSLESRNENQRKLIVNIQRNDINFGIGPAGTGKTYLAVACAVQALLEDRIQRILLVRPAVEAGEKLGFLPGDLAQKIDPYLRPLYDALYEMLGTEKVSKLMERNIIEIAPLAFMRGRSLNHSFIILDESQNTTREQMKMFLTRIGFGSTAVITGDISQIDLPRGAQSGLKHAMAVLKDIDGISFTQFDAKDVVRHPLIQRIVNAYDAHDSHYVPSDDNR